MLKLSITLKLTFLWIFAIGLLTSVSAQEIVNNKAVISTSGGVITLKNFELTNNGTIRDSFMTWRIIGDADTADSEMGGDSLTIIKNLEVDKTGAGAASRLKGHFKVLGTITLTDGSLLLDTNTIELGDNGWIVYEDDNNRIFSFSSGTIFKDTTLNAPTALNPGNLGAELTSSANLGDIRIIRGHDRQYNTNANGWGILRYYDFEPTTNTSLNLSLRFYYLNSEIAPYNHAELDMWLKKSTVWLEENVPFTAGARDSNNTWIQSTGLDTLYRVTLGSTIRNVLPVNWLNVSAHWITAPKEAQVDWQTASEDQVARFDIERSYDGEEYTLVGQVPAAGNSASITKYGFVDNQVDPLKVSQLVFYRIKQVDEDGVYTYSEILPLPFKNADIHYLVYPNPASNLVNVKITGSINPYQISVTDAFGKIVEELVVNGNKKQLSTNVNLDFSGYADGTYFIRFIDSYSGVRKTIRVVKVD